MSGPSTAATRSEAPELQRRRGVSLATRLAASVLGIGLAALTAATLVGVAAGQSLGRGIVENGVESLLSSGTSEAAAQVRSYQRLAAQLGSSPQAPEAIEAFSEAFDEIASTDGQVRSGRRELLEEYRDRYLQPLRESGQDVDIADVLPEDPRAVYLQATYVLAADSRIEPIEINDPGDGSAWTRVHERYHPAYRSAVRQAGLLDAYLVEAAGGRVVYSAAKGPALGTSLVVGPFSGSLVARSAAAAAQSGTPVASDLGYYRGVPDIPIGAAAAPVRDGDTVVGSVVITYDAGIYTQRLGSLVDAATDSPDQSLYLIGVDGTTRSDPQAYTEDPQAFLDASQAAGVLSDEARLQIERRGTTVLAQPATDATVKAALDGNAQVVPRMDMTGTEAFTGVQPLPVDGVDWYTVSEIDASTASAAVSTFRQILIVGTAVFVTVLAFAAVAWSRSFMRPVRAISDRLARAIRPDGLDATQEPLAIPERSPVEFHRLADSLAAMARSLRRQMRELTTARAARLDLLEQMLPPSVAQRVARGDVESVDEVPSASVVVVVVNGLGDLVGEDPGGTHRRLLDDLHAELDGIALEEGLDRIKVIGDAYFGVCGHDRPYIDHAPRAVRFAERAAAAVRDAAAHSSARLDTTAGVSTGPVTVGMSGGERLVYDVWGATVTTAHDLARMADSDQIVVTEATRVRLPQQIPVAPWPGDASPAGARRAGTGPDIWLVTGRDAKAGAEAGA